MLPMANAGKINATASTVTPLLSAYTGKLLLSVVSKKP
ncbi:hypothetical protein BSAF29S_02994 [Bacillus safensis subsp. safensis]